MVTQGSNKYDGFLTNILNKNSCGESKDDFLQTLRQYSNEEESHISIFDPDFISYFLSILRDLSAEFKQTDVTCASNADNVLTVCSKNTSASFQRSSLVESKSAHGFGSICDASFNGRMMSTPKFRDDIATPISSRNRVTSLTGRLSDHRPPKFTPNYKNSDLKSESQRSASHTNQRPKSKPLNLSDFLSPEAGSQNAHNPYRKKQQKSKQKGRRNTPGHSFVNSSHSDVSGSMYSPNDMMRQMKPSRADMKSPVNPLFSEASRSISFDIADQGDFPSLALGSPSAQSSFKPSRRIKPTAVTVNKDGKLLSLGANQSPIHEGKLQPDGICLAGPNPFLSGSPLNPAKTGDLQEERQLLMRMKLQDDATKKEKSNLKTPMKCLEDISPVKRVSTDANPARVFEKNKILRWIV